MSRTNIVLDEHLVEDGFRLTGLKTKKELVNFALKELVRHKKQERILQLKGKICWEGDLNEMRQKREF